MTLKARITQCVEYIMRRGHRCPESGWRREIAIIRRSSKWVHIIFCYCIISEMQRLSSKVALTVFSERGIGVPLASFVSGYPDRLWFSSWLRSRGYASSSAARVGRSFRQFDVGQFARLVSVKTQPSSMRCSYAF
jgi:hypothetical protein